MRTLEIADRVRYAHMNTAELRDTFLVQDLFTPGVINAVYVDLDRTVLGSAVPLSEPLTLGTYPELRSEYFTERREIGMLNIGGSGSIFVDGETFSLARLESLYIGRGSREINFASDNSDDPAAFYLLSYLAHTTYPTMKAIPAAPTPLGSVESCNARDITRLIHLDGVRSCQLVMGYTQLHIGSNWNTMPPHTHGRRSEIYLYFDLPPAERVIHLMGPPQETRSLIVADRQIIVSPNWSIHAGVGTRSYSFCWGMGGENQVYSDMDAVTAADLK
jgi:4-deoxy-L-threo-5-hexosulose-uronate ketol-isomerase